MRSTMNYDLGHRRLLNADGVVVLVYHERLGVPGSPLAKAREAMAQGLGAGVEVSGGFLVQCLLTDQAGGFKWQDFVMVSPFPL